MRFLMPARWVTTALVMSLVIAACAGGGSATPAPTPAPTAAATEAPSSDPTPEPVEPETTSFAVAFGGPGVSTVALLSAIRLLNEEGWKIETPELSAGELQLQGVASGQFQLSSGSGPGVMKLAQEGLPVRIVMSRIKNEWTLYARSSITQCSQLGGVKLAIHSEGSPATFMTRDYIANECAGTEPNYIILPGSENRFAALLADEIDASPIELSDAIQLEAQGAGRFNRLASFAEELPNLLLTPIYVNSAWAEQNPNTVALLLKKVLEQHRRFNADPAYFKEEIVRTLEGVNQDTIDETVAAYVELEMYDPTGGITAEQQQFSISFVEKAGGIAPGLTPDKAFDRSYLDKALELLGG